MRFLADISRELVCHNTSEGEKRFDPSKAVLVFQTMSGGGEAGWRTEDYYFVTPDGKNVLLSFRRKGAFRESVDHTPNINVYDETKMRAFLAIAKCPIEIVEKHFGRQEVK